MTEPQQPFGDTPASGQGDLLALIRLYNDMTPEQRAELLRVARGMVRQAEKR